ncbi:hypothetical protein CR51_08980 [Caballeronia megalochromosomata]|nr:hypothetical protein CR51_08980 [Caballeronia megalochromosomata]
MPELQSDQSLNGTCVRRPKQPSGAHDQNKTETRHALDRLPALAGLIARLARWFDEARAHACRPTRIVTDERPAP